jgi:glutathione S-transferase
LATGRYEWSTLGQTLDQQGFVHASTAAQLPGVVHFIYRDVTDPLVLLGLDVDALERAGSRVRWDDVPSAPAPFPHVYGAVPVDAVTSVTPFDPSDPVWPPG